MWEVLPWAVLISVGSLGVFLVVMLLAALLSE